MRPIAIVIFFVCHFAAFSQTLEGKVYDSKSVVEDIKVWNKTQNRLTVTDENGDFNIEAEVNDTIEFQSVFYHPKTIIVKQSHFDGINVFQVKEIVNELDEVEIKDSLRSKFDSIAFYKTINSEKKTLTEQPLMKSGENLMPTLDLKLLYKGVSKLFRKRKNKNLENKIPLDYKQLESFFATDDFFNKELLTIDLKIPENKINVFIDYCAEKGIRKELLKDENKMQLLEELVVNSQLFLILLEEYGEESTVKD